jgi:tRNA(Arg) A34 adenosine deaminase TadA
MVDEKFMEVAIVEARKSLQIGNLPFGAVLVKGNKIVARAHNKVYSEKNPISHAELNLIMQFSRKSKRLDLSGHVLYATCEPCPMCGSAIGWAKISRVVFGALRSDKLGTYKRQTKGKFVDDLRKQGITIQAKSGVLREEILELYKLYKE